MSPTPLDYASRLPPPRQQITLQQLSTNVLRLTIDPPRRGRLAYETIAAAALLLFGGLLLASLAVVVIGGILGEPLAIASFAAVCLVVPFVYAAARAVFTARGVVIMLEVFGDRVTWWTETMFGCHRTTWPASRVTAVRVQPIADGYFVLVLRGMGATDAWTLETRSLEELNRAALTLRVALGADQGRTPQRYV